jgi:hypothetical protein
MKKQYENIVVDVIFFFEEDIVRTSPNDNVTDMPEFPENFEG